MDGGKYHEKIITYVALSLLVSVFMINPLNVQARNSYTPHKCKISTKNLNPCDNMLYPNESFYIDGVFEVEGLDLTNDRVYNSWLDAWIPLATVREIDKLGRPYGDDVLYKGEFFVINIIGTGLDGTFKVTGNYGSDRIQTVMKNKWGYWEYVWINAGPLQEYGCNH